MSESGVEDGPLARTEVIRLCRETYRAAKEKGELKIMLACVSQLSKLIDSITPPDATPKRGSEIDSARQALSQRNHR